MTTIRMNTHTYGLYSALIALVLALELGFVGAPTALAAPPDCTAIVNGGLWHDPATWDCGHDLSTVPAGRVAEVPAGLAVTVPAGVTVNIFGTVRVRGTVDIQGGAGISNYSLLGVATGGQINNQGGKLDNATSGTLRNEGTIENTNAAVLSNAGTLNNSALLRNISGAEVSVSAGILNNSGTIRNEANVKNTINGTVNNLAGGTIDSNGAAATITNDIGCSLVNDGTLHNTNEATFTNNGSLINNGLLENAIYAMMENELNASIENYGLIDNLKRSTISNQGIIENDGEANIINRGKGSLLSNYSGGQLYNRGMLTNTYDARMVNTTFFADIINLGGILFNNDGAELHIESGSLQNVNPGSYFHNGPNSFLILERHLINEAQADVVNDGWMRFTCGAYVETPGNFQNNYVILVDNFTDVTIDGQITGNAPVDMVYPCW